MSVKGTKGQKNNTFRRYYSRGFGDPLQPVWSAINRGEWRSTEHQRLTNNNERRQCHRSDIDLMVLSTWYPSSPGSPRSPRSPGGPCIERCTCLNTHATHAHFHLYPHTLSGTGELRYLTTDPLLKPTHIVVFTHKSRLILESNRKVEFDLEPVFC